jgi:hypothetical protein
MTALVYVLEWGGLTVDYFFDEMWRVDYLRSANFLTPYFTHDTPIPPGWVVLFSPVGHLTGAPWVFRSLTVLSLVAFLAGALALALTCLAARELPKRERRRRIAVCLGAVLILPVLPGMADVSGYVNNYPFEAAYLVWLLVCVATIDRWRASWICALILIAIGPLFTISPVFAFPAIVCWLAYRWWVGGRRRRLVALAASAVVSLGCLATVFLVFYRPIVPAGFGFWAPLSLRSSPLGPLGLSRTAASTFVATVTSGFAPSPSAAVRHLLMVAVFLLLAGGFLILGRGRRWLPTVLLTAWVVAAIASKATDWPLTPSRVNLSFVALFYLAIGLALFRLVDLAVRHASVTLLAVAGVLALAWPHVAVASRQTFAVGLRADLAPIGSSPSTTNLVLSYHFMSHFYTDDFLINDRHGNRDYVVVRDKRGDRALYGDLNAYVDRYVPPGGMLWCVIPFAVGPIDAASACQIDRADMRLVIDQRGNQAEIRGFLRAAR